MQDFLRNIFSRGSYARTDSPVLSVGGVSSNSATLTYDVMHFDATGNLLVNAAVGGAGGAQSGSWTVAVTGTPAVNVVQWGSSNVLSASFGVPTVGWFQRLDATNDAILAYGQARTNDPAPAAANSSATPIITDSLGKQVCLPGAINDLHLDGQATIAGVLTASVIASQGAGRRIAVQAITLSGTASAPVQVVISGGPSNRTLGTLPTGVSGPTTINAGGAALYITSASAALSAFGSITATFNIFASGYSLSN